MSRRWRPSLWLVLFGALGATLAMSFAGLVALRYLGPVTGFRLAAMLLGALILAATAGLGWLMLRLILRPVIGLGAYATAQRESRPAPVPTHFGTRELHFMGARVIDMAEALRDREATIRSFTDHVTHELKTPVSAIRAASELIADGGALSEDDSRLLSDIDAARARIEQLLAALRRAAQAREARYLGETRLDDVTPQLRADHPALRLVISGGELALPLAAEGLLTVLAQLLRNAAEAGADQVDLRVTHEEGATLLSLSDNGPGIPAALAPQLFDPFFTTRRATGGTGMGLTIAANLLAAHRATITLADQPPDTAGGARFVIRFPA